MNRTLHLPRASQHRQLPKTLFSRHMLRLVCWQQKAAFALQKQGSSDLKRYCQRGTVCPIYNFDRRSEPIRSFFVRRFTKKSENSDPTKKKHARMRKRIGQVMRQAKVETKSEKTMAEWSMRASL
jgi:hypothetical protein